MVAKVTLQTIADQVGVSRMTVSNAFSRPDQLSQSMRDRILAAAEELGYVGPDPRARALARGRTGAVGILLTDSLAYAFTDEVAMALMGAIASELAPTGLALTLLSATTTGDLVPARDVPMDGALVYSCDPATPAIRWLHKRGLPLVYIDQRPDPDVPSVNIDDRGGARAVAQHLIDLGHRRMGAIVSVVGVPTGPVADPAELPMDHSTSERVRGWDEALEAVGVRAEYVQAGEYAHDEFVRAARILLDRPDPPTAVLCFSDAIAAAVLQEAHDRGLEVPRDLSVVGFDDNPLARRTRPTLTTVRQDSRAKGRAAAAALTAVIAQAHDRDHDQDHDPDHDVPPTAEHRLLPADLVVRDSTGHVPS